MRLTGISCVVPKRRVLSTEAYERFPKADVDRIVNNIGVREHREAEPGVTASDLCLPAGEALLDRLGWPRESVDAVVLVTQTPDHYVPGSSHRLHAKLGLKNSAIALDLTLGCSGFTHGMIVAQSLMSNGVAKRALLFCGDVSTNRFRPGVRECTTTANLGNAMLFGDAVGVVALESDGAEQLRAKIFGADGTGYEHIYIPGGGFRNYWNADLLEYKADEKGDLRRPLDLVLNGAEVFTFTIRRVPPMIDEVLRQAEWTREEVDSFVFHQANKFMLDFLRKKAKIPEDRAPLSIQEFGNTSSASIPMTMLTRAADRFDKPTKWVMLGFGLGLSWSAVAVETDGITSVPLIEV